MNTILKALTSLDCRIMDFKSLAKRFFSGVVVGLLIVLLAWSYSAFFHVSISPVQGLIGALFLTISCGVITAVTNLDTLMDNFPPL
ncbi:MAG: hypothetical protein F6K30_18615 [Cyanothece sp. SIO2G6]|nr:hypothetical protein [Cyanothece sp. SIO2G6]